jgi:hypothetical protein
MDADERADAGFANPEVYEFLEAALIKYAIRLPANRVTMRIRRTRSRSHGEVDSDRRSGRVRLRPPTLELSVMILARYSSRWNSVVQPG